jgi:putative flippase GtrA
MRSVRTRQFLQFTLVGTAGFVVDTAALYAAIYWLGTGPYFGRVFSYLFAATFTWISNRRYTFKDQRDPRLVGEWFRFLAGNAIGGLINYGVYAALLATLVSVSRWPVLGVAAGSLAGLITNFNLSRRWVFKSDGR